MIRSQRGVSLVEILIVVAISGMIVVSTFTTYASSYQQYKWNETKSLLSQDALLLSNYLSRQFQQVGGGSVRVWQAIWLEDNSTCANRAPFGACLGSDRVSLATLSNPALECPVVSFTAPNIYQIGNNPSCCFSAALAGHQIVLTLNGMWSQQYVQIADVSACKITVADGPMAPNDGLTGLPATKFTGGVMSQVDVKTLYVDTVKHQLFSFSDLNNNGAIDSGESVLLADQVYDLQISLGYDSNPVDGIIQDSNDNTDEWLNNSVGASEALGAGAFAGATPDQLRMIQFGLILGTPMTTSGAGNSVQVLNGNAVSDPNALLLALVTKISPRNLGIFQ